MEAIGKVENCVREEYADFLAILEYDLIYRSNPTPVHNIVVVHNDACIFHLQERDSSRLKIELDGILLIEDSQLPFSKRWVEVASEGKPFGTFSSISCFQTLLMETYLPGEITSDRLIQKPLTFQYDPTGEVREVFSYGNPFSHKRDQIPHPRFCQMSQSMVEQAINTSLEPVDRAFALLRYLRQGTGQTYCKKNQE